MVELHKVNSVQIKELCSTGQRPKADRAYGF